MFQRDCEYRNKEMGKRDDRHTEGIEVPQVNDKKYESMSQGQKCTEHSSHIKCITRYKNRRRNVQIIMRMVTAHS